MSPRAEFERENLSPDGISLRTGRVASVRRTLRGAVTSDAASDGSREGAKPLRKFRFENSLRGFTPSRESLCGVAFAQGTSSFGDTELRGHGTTLTDCKHAASADRFQQIEPQ